ncbi:MAG: TIGR04222 domain-containing membrane protein, partial [Moorea sp. SIO2B7]|nr:TIGR04222 domain-containing membrane protein [Moorena sp. SIO2B7]
TVYKKNLQNEYLLYPTEAKQTSYLIISMGMLIILGLDGYKLIVALAKGYSNVEFLIIIGLVSLCILLFGCKTPHLSVRGTKYLQQLQQAFNGLKSKIKDDYIANDDPETMLLIATFGVGVLAGTDYADFEQMFRPATVSRSNSRSNSSSSCGGGSSCGSSCGGGCGGGCGGCGGCGG